METTVIEGCDDRRGSRRRRSLNDHGIVALRVRLGRAAAIVDVSAGGALIETDHRLLPGTSVELYLETKDRHLAARARVLRCSVVLVQPASIRYRGAVSFDRQLPWFLDESNHGYTVPGPEMRAGSVPRADSTQAPL